MPDTIVPVRLIDSNMKPVGNIETAQIDGDLPIVLLWHRRFFMLTRDNMYLEVQGCMVHDVNDMEKETLSSHTIITRGAGVVAVSMTPDELMVQINDETVLHATDIHELAVAAPREMLKYILDDSSLENYKGKMH